MSDQKPVSTTSSKISRFFTKPKTLLTISIFILLVAAVVAFIIIKSSPQDISSGEVSLPVSGDSSGIDWSKYPTYTVELSDSLEIKQAGVYQLSGNIAGGNITVETDDNVKLVLNNVSVTNSSGPAIFVRDAKNVVISTAEGTVNNLQDGKSYSGYEADEVGTIFSHDDLFLEGDGVLNVTSNNEDAIVSKDDLEFISGTYNIVAADDAIRGKDSVHIVSGTFKIEAAADAIKSTEDTDSEKGYVYIENGDINITAGDDAIHATSNLVIDQGNIAIAKSYEGLEGTTITINDGNITISASDDGINAAGGNDGSSLNRPGANPFMSNDNNYIRIHGGKITVNSDGDGIDSNGNIYIDGGEIIVYGPTTDMDSALDYDGECVMSGGVLIAGGPSGMAQGISDNSSINSLQIFFSSNYGQGDKISIINAAQQEVASYSSTKNFNSLVIVSPQLELNQTYTILVNDAKYDDVTLTGVVTQAGNSGTGFAPGGGRQTNGGSDPGRPQSDAPRNMPR